MAKAKKEEGSEKETKQLDSKSVLNGILKQHKDEHFNFQERVDWSISSGSLLWDLSAGPIRPSLVRIAGFSGEGKSAQALEIIRQFLTTVENSKALWVLAEGRGLSDEHKERCGLKFVYSPDEWEVGSVFVLETQVYEVFIQVVRDLVLNNPEKIKFGFCVDSIDGLSLRADRLKDVTDSNVRVAGAPALSKRLMQSLSLGMFKYGHLMLMLSQVSSEIKIDPYAKTTPRMGNFGGGSSLTHCADLIVEYSKTYNSDYILDNPSGKMNDGKSKSIGKYTRVTIHKVAKETGRGTTFQYPVKFNRKVSGVWLERELGDLLMSFSLITKAGAGWMTVNAEFMKELTENGFEFPEKVQGFENLYKELEERPELVKYLFEKFKSMLC